MGIDPGFTNLGVGIFDGKIILLSRVDLTVEELDTKELVRVELNESRYVETIRLFVVSNYALLTTVERFATEMQMDPKLISLELAILAYLKATFPHTDVLRVSPVTTREFFNTRVLDPRLSADEAYALRKRLSVEVLQNFFGPEAICAITHKFAGKIDDAAEAAILAVFLFFMTVNKPRSNSIGHRVVKHIASVKFIEASEVPLTPEQRRPIVLDPPAPKKRRSPAASKPPSKKRKAETDAGSTPKKQKSRFFEAASGKNLTISE
jgi:hypothetical protein